MNLPSVIFYLFSPISRYTVSVSVDPRLLVDLVKYIDELYGLIKLKINLEEGDEQFLIITSPIIYLYLLRL